jgi:tight adherence protein C
MTSWFIEYGALLMALLLAGSAGVFVVAISGSALRRGEAAQRLSGAEAMANGGAYQAWLRDNLQSLVRQVGERLAPPKDGERVTGLALRLRRAGFTQRDAPTWFYGIRGLITVLLPVAVLGALGLLYTGLSSVQSMALSAAAAGLGFILPSFLLDIRVGELKNEYRAGFPDVLDLLVVCIESGMTLEAGLDRIVGEIADVYPNLHRAISQMLLELRAGRDRGQALFALADRLGLDEATSFANMIVQAEQLGSSIATALRLCADEMREKRLLRVEEYAQALPVLLTMPLGAFVFPGILVVTLMPALIVVYESFIATAPQ